MLLRYHWHYSTEQIRHEDIFEDLPRHMARLNFVTARDSSFLLTFGATCVIGFIDTVTFFRRFFVKTLSIFALTLIIPCRTFPLMCLL
jgi:hypothetical protein